MLLNRYEWTPLATKRECWASASDGQGAAADPGAANGGGTPAPDWGKFTESLNNIPAAIQAEMRQQLGEMKGLRQDVAALTPKEAPAELPDFDSMTQSEVVQYLQEHNATLIRDAVREALTPLAEQFTTFQRSVVEDQGKRTVDQMKAENKDFADWKDDMISLAQQHPSLDIPSLYRLAKANNPTKAAELQARYNPPPPPKPKPFSFTDGITAPRSGDLNRVLTKSEAVHSAAAEVAQRHPGVLSALRDL